MMIALVAALLSAAPSPVQDPVFIKIVEQMHKPLPPPPSPQTGYIADLLKGTVTNKETEKILNTLARMEPDTFLACLNALEAKHWKGNLSMFDKLVKRGLDDRASFLAEFAEQLNNKLELGFTPLSTLYAARLAKLGDKGSAESRNRKALRRSNRDMVRASKDLYKFLGLKDRLGVRRAVNSMGEGLKKAGIAVGSVITAPLWIPFLLIFGADMIGD